MLTRDLNPDYLISIYKLICCHVDMFTLRVIYTNIHRDKTRDKVSHQMWAVRGSVTVEEEAEAGACQMLGSCEMGLIVAGSFLFF